MYDLREKEEERADESPVLEVRLKVKRRVNFGRKEIIESVNLARKNIRTVWVRLSNGDVIKRKNRDIIKNKEIS